MAEVLNHQPWFNEKQQFHDSFSFEEHARKEGLKNIKFVQEETIIQIYIILVQHCRPLNMFAPYCSNYTKTSPTQEYLNRYVA
jgi:hypothetical protein